MHLIVPFAGTVSEAGLHALQSLALPRLGTLLARLQPVQCLGSDAFSLNPPHELALATAWGWPAASDASRSGAATADTALPFAARQAAALGLDTGQPWGLLTPVHLHVGTDQVSLTPPSALQLDDTASRELLEIVRPLFETEGFTLHHAGPLQWLATHALFDGLATASLDRVTGRNVNRWLPDHRSARLIRRLQNEVQMLLYTHAVNDRREAAGLPTVNSVWLSHCGRLPAGTRQADDLQTDDRLREPALGEDWAAWCEAWQALDAGPIDALARAGSGARLTLCGERFAQTYAAAPQGLWQRLASRWQAPAAHTVLESL
ncbi:MAG: hypothetical protein QE285_04205 [Aquabacterium sp.]|nr:hypothetical protein [Aquabacterium sp.]